MTNEEHTNDAQGATAEEAKVEKMFEYGYRKSNYGPDELVTDAHGNPISVVDAMLSAEDAAKAETSTPHLCYYSPHSGQYRFGNPPMRGDRHDPAFGGAARIQSARYEAAPRRTGLPRHGARGIAPEF